MALEATVLPDGAVKLSDGRVIRPATQNQIRAEQLVEDVFNDPEIGGRLHEKAQKKFGDIKPHQNAVLKQAIVEPEVNAIKSQLEATEKQLAKALERLDQRDQRDEEEKTYKEMDAAVNGAVKKYQLTEEGKQKLLDRMKEMKNYTDVEAAAAFVVHNAPPAPSKGPSWAPRKNDFFGTANADETFASLHKDPEGFRDEEIAKFLADPDAYAAAAA